MTSEHAAWEELAAGYALNALEPEDEHAFAEHLRHCERCRRELAALGEVAAGLAYAAEPADPPPQLGARILDAAAAERTAVFGRTPPPPRLEPAPPRARPSAYRVAAAVSAAAIAVVMGLGAWNLSLRAKDAAKDAALARRGAALDCLLAQDAVTFPMDPRSATCVAGRRAYVIANFDPNDPDASVYVLWWVDRAGAPHAVGAFDVEPGTAGTAVLEMPLDVAAADVRAVAVSLEPGRTVPARPTRQIAYGTPDRP